MASPPSSVPSTSGGISMPCQCTNSGVSVAFTTSTVTGLPSSCARIDRGVPVVTNGGNDMSRIEFDRHRSNSEGNRRESGGYWRYLHRLRQRGYASTAPVLPLSSKCKKAAPFSTT